MKKIAWIIILCLSIFQANAQIVSVTPYFPTVADDVTITYDATQGNAGLLGQTQVYMHTGLITDKSSSNSDWQHVTGNWGQADPKVKMNYIGNNKHIISFNIKSFYGVAANEQVYQMAFVFRNADGSKEGKTVDLKDIFSPVYAAGSGLLTKLASPQELSQIVNTGDSISVLWYASKSCNIVVKDNNQITKQLSGALLDFQLKTNQAGLHKVTIEAETGSEMAKDSFYYTINPAVTIEDLPNGIEPGINRINDNSIIFALYAPYKKYVYLTGDFNNWLPDENYFMKKTSDGNTWWVEVNNLDANTEYAFQYWVDGLIKIGDPYSEKVLDPFNDGYISASVYPNLKKYPAGKTTGYVSVVKPKPDIYQWQNTTFVKPKKTNLVIYELLVRDFLQDHNYVSLKDTLDYLANLGVNAIELMPVNEFEGNIGWGYNPAYQLALDKYYGTPEALKTFIDECHKRGIAVIFDMVLNHACGQCPLVDLYFDNKNNQVSPESPYFNIVAKHPYNVCYDMNHESKATQYFVDRVLKHWIEEFHFDGYRFDLSKGITQHFSSNDQQMSAYDASRIQLLDRMAKICWAQDSSFYVILEHFAVNQEEKELSSKGMMLWGNLNYNFLQASMAYTSDLTGLSYQYRGWTDANLVGYMESHDEERMLFKDVNFGNSKGNYNIKKLNTALDRAAMSAAFFYAIPGPKLMWMFGELGYDYSINHCEDGSENSSCRTSPKPIRWDYLSDDGRLKLYKIYSALIHLKTSQNVFETKDYSQNVSGIMKSIHLNSSEMNVVVLGNFGVDSSSIDPIFHHIGTWYDYFTGDSLQVSDVHFKIGLKAGEYHIYIDKKLAIPDTKTSTLDINKPENTNFKIYPNPATREINIALAHFNSTPIKVNIYGIDGKMIFEKTFKNLASGDYELTILLDKAVKNGLYFVRIETDDWANTQKLFIFNH